MEILRVEHLSKVYGKGDTAVKALDNVSFSVQKGEFVAIIGPSGSGKSTLLHILGGVDIPTAGKVYIDGTDVYKLNQTNLAIFRRRQIGLIYQFFNLIPVLNVEENITLPLLLDGRKVDPKHLQNLIATLGLEKRLGHLPNQLSGGQQQRVSIGRALANSPALVLADEPTGALDSKSAKLLLDRLEHLNREMGATILMVTHDAFTASCCRRVVFLRDGQIFLELRRGGEDRRAFFQKIIRVVSEMGGEMADVL